jgi:hypothetical protein
MGKPLTVTIPHALGAAEAKRRISEGMDRLRQQYASQITRADIAWQGDRAELKVGALGQTIDARVDVGEDALRIEVDLPWLLQKLARPLETFLARTGADTLKIGKS